MPHTAHAHAPHHSASDVADYLVVVSNDDDYHASYHNFAEKVNRKLKAGYLLHGSPVCMGRVLCQAMVRPAGAAHSGDTTIFFKSPVGHE